MRGGRVSRFLSIEKSSELTKNLSLDDRQLAHFTIGDTQQQNGVRHVESFLR